MKVCTGYPFSFYLCKKGSIFRDDVSYHLLHVKEDYSFTVHNVFSDAGRDWGQEEKGMTEDEMAG